MTTAGWIPDVQWSEIFLPTVPFIEIFVRGSVIYLTLFFMLRLFKNRTSGGVGVTDVLLIVLIADAVQNAMAGEYKSISEGIVLAATIFFWAFLLDWLAWRFPRLRPVLKSPALAVVSDGLMIRRAMRKELLSEDDLMAELRKHDIHDLTQVARACVEGDGSLTVIRAPVAAPVATPGNKNTHTS